MRSIQILNEKTYDQLDKVKNIHLTPSLFPTGKITINSLAKMISSKVLDKQYDIVFHFNEKEKDELVGKLEATKIKISKTGRNWYIMFTDSDRATTERRARNIVTNGLVSSLAIDEALAASN